MNENSQSNTQSQLLEENKHVKDLTEILKAIGLDSDAQCLTDVVSHVSAMEKELKSAMGELNTLRRELATVKEGQDHPVRTMLQKAADSLMQRFKSLLGKVQAMKDKIIGGCKQAVEDIKDKGISAANVVAGVLDIRGDLQATREAINSNIVHCEKQIAKIDAASTELHSAGMHVRNIGRAIMGREPVHDIKPNGKLAALLKTPFRNEIKAGKRALVRNDKALERLDDLEKAAALVAEKNRPSALDEIKRHREAVAQAVPTAPKPVRVKVAGQEI